MVKFEKVKKFANIDFPMPVRKTTNSAGYDFAVAEDTIVPPYKELVNQIYHSDAIDLQTLANITKQKNLRPTLVPTGVKCKMEPNQYLSLTVRSSTPLKYWLILANGEGIIDADYYNSPDNEGLIFFQLINLTRVPIILHRGDVIGQGIIKTYDKIDEDTSTASREGGFGSTDE